LIKNIIFDLGDIFMNLNKGALTEGILKYGGSLDLFPELIKLNESFEVGNLTAKEFINQLINVFPKATNGEVINIWNTMLLGIPEYRLLFLDNLAHQNNKRLFLLSNTNPIHIKHIEEQMGLARFNQFKHCFEKFYLSHEIKLRKPSLAVYDFVLEENDLSAKNTLFIDDSKANTDAVENLGIKCWNLLVGEEDVVNLFSKFPEYFS